MRSAREVGFRIRQEVANLRMWIRPPRLPKSAGGALPTHLPPAGPVAKRLRGSMYAKQVTDLADEVLAHRFRLLGLDVNLGSHIEWRADTVHKKATGLAYFRLIPYLDFQRVGDHKIIWELNRHQHLVILAQAFLLTGREEYLREVERQLTGWWRQNPFSQGINWSSALEVAFRALSWMWLDHFAGQQLRVREQLLGSLHQHGCYLETNLSIYFSPNTHLLGEALALEVLGTAYPWLPRAQRWKQTGAKIMNGELKRQVRADGSHFEQSSYYHVYALDFFLLHKMLGELDPEQNEILRRMAEYLESLMGPGRRLPLLGDDDGGRLFGLPFRFRETGRASQATAAVLLGGDLPFKTEDLEEQAAWWLGAEILDRGTIESKDRRSRIYSDAGVGAMEAHEVHILIDGGPFGVGTGGHSHSDTLSLIVRDGDEDILIDPGTYTYVSNPEWRDRFRGSAAHNTMRIDSRDQAIPVSAFRWANPPQVELLAWESAADRDYFDGVCRYGGFQHRRRVVFLKQMLLLLVLDEIKGPPGEDRVEHGVEQFWHFAAPPRPVAEGRYWIGQKQRVWLALAASGRAEITEGGEYGWRSAALGQKALSPVLRMHDRCELPVRWAAGFGFGGQEAIPRLTVHSQEDDVSLQMGDITVRFSHRIPKVVSS